MTATISVTVNPGSARRSFASETRSGRFDDAHQVLMVARLTPDSRTSHAWNP